MSTPPTDRPRSTVSVVVPSWNTIDLTRICLEFLYASDRPVEEVIVVDNGSEDGSADMIAERFPAVRLVRNARNEGFARGCNQGIELATQDLVLLLNTDTEMAPDALGLMVAWLDENPGYGAVAPKLVHRDGRVQPTCMRFPGLATPFFYDPPVRRWFPESREMRRYYLRDWDQESSRDVDQPPAAVLLVRRSVLDDIGPFDEQFWLFYNDVDLSLRMAKAGWKTRYLAEARVVHHVGASTSRFANFLPEWQRNRLAYYRKHFGAAAGVWVKVCVSLSWFDHWLRNLLLALRGKPHEDTRQITEAFREFLRS
ncbi:glycosyltransferase family 2 protein [Engelhardtia mirabilis]|uniref:N-acetylglucosaminyl-diphospho-decaprenol L-rhamnosyltransferase n=1 Tax=Engelhardtia mirabilis TaxID=2528011 RepID=A0A518BK79_9BACT|nr:N-acetylglucosaminyl-diphospho-decaprenol L-rhamnosyltransferase [Planctomycetes bacterium Pla133]QDV01705.1 N-acetylglucosaminyl-diphospho-decaprenol L-rhamnosyltransferase [Planctomycetes bacterium Pla86]